MAKAGNDTPLMQQHKVIKHKYPDAILLFRVGDFYETFGQDAVLASQILGITLTKRNNGAAASSELAGFPHHALDTYLHKLVKAGHRVAICDQLEDPKQAKGIVKRGVTEMVTPGTAINDKLLEHNSNNFLAGIHMQGDDQYGLAFLDISTGEFFAAQGDREYAEKLVQSFKPAEVVYQRSYQKKFKELFGSKIYSYTLDEWIFDITYAQDALLKHFETQSLKGFGIEDLKLGWVAAAAILHYLKDTEHPHLQHILAIHRIDRGDFLWMDRFTIRNLELVQGHAEGNHTLLSVLDNTVSPMGARLLKRWIIFPLNNILKINERLDAVTHLIKDVDMRSKLTQAIRQCGDIERIIAKVPLKKINPREVVHLSKALQWIADIKNICIASQNEYLKRIGDTLNPCPLIAQKISHDIMESPSVMASKGNVINEGVIKELDDLRNISRKGKEYLLQLQQKEAATTGISSLKIAYNNVFGYYLEVTNAHKDKVPATWMRKQTLSNAERYITPELKEYEEKITGAEEKILQLEIQYFESVVTELLDYIEPIQLNASMLATLDCLLSFSSTAVHNQYFRPVVDDGETLLLKESRHPVIEKNLPVGEPYISNDVELNKNDQQIIILTGPNMSGKSALLRQAALITLMAHMGSYVPARNALIPLTDRIFTRVGASDNVSGGESTFMVEMNETASIINNITARSLILLDEIGRGTSTYDGISIAWSIVEYLHQSPHQPKTLFATHYHELNELEDKFSRIKNYHVSIKEISNKILFLRKIEPGGSTHSFGIHVARMAGMPPSLIARANEVLAQLEVKHVDEEADGFNNESIYQKVKKLGVPQVQLSIFDTHSEIFSDIRNLLDTIDINRLTPVEALLKLQEIKGKLK